MMLQQSSARVLFLMALCVVGSQGFIPLPLRSKRTLHHSNCRSSIRNGTAEHRGLRGLHPPSNPYKNDTLVVFTDGCIQHEIYYEVHGGGQDDDAPLTALFLHGGPGAGCFPNHARFFDPKVYRIVLMDQRGSGQSMPRGETAGNTLLDIVSDCELLRKHLGIAEWNTILGGSWGVTVAVAYAQEFPNRIQSIILRGVCLFRAMEIDWMFSSDGYARCNREAWVQFASAVTNNNDNNNNTNGNDDDSPSSSPRDTLYRYYDRLLGDNAHLRIQAARSWMQYEMQVFASSTRTEINTAPVAVLKNSKWSYQDQSGNRINESSIDETSFPNLKSIDFVPSLCESQLPLLKEDDDNYGPVASSSRPVRQVIVERKEEEDESSLFVPAQNMLTCYYSVNRKYVMNGIDLLDPTRMKRIQHIPCIAVHGKQDRVCPVTTALDLAHAWPTMELRIPMRSGHSMYDAAIANELVQATDRMAQLLLANTNVCRMDVKS